MPPLNQRKEDVLPIAQHFLVQFAREEGKKFEALAPEVEGVLRDFDWPGNVRQLRNALRSIVVLYDGIRVERSMLPPPLNEAGRPQAESEQRATAPAPNEPARPRPLHEVERAAIEEAIQCCGGNIVQAAEMLEISPSTIYRKRAAWTGSSIH